MRSKTTTQKILEFYDSLKNVDINSYTLQLKLTRKVLFLRVYNLLLIRMLKTSAKKGA